MHKFIFNILEYSLKKCVQFTDYHKRMKVEKKVAFGFLFLVFVNYILCGIMDIDSQTSSNWAHFFDLKSSSDELLTFGIIIDKLKL